jgi:hypothetical protein
MAEMTATEREQLLKLARRREEVAKSELKSRSAQLLADVEAQLAAMYKIDHELWAEITRQAKRAVEEADQTIARICRTNGIPDEFRPALHIYWQGRGENACNERRAELRKVAQTKIAALEAEGKVLVERASVDAQTKIVAASLTTEAAKALLEEMPTAEQLMPSVDVRTIELGPPKAPYTYTAIPGPGYGG